MSGVVFGGGAVGSLHAPTIPSRVVVIAPDVYGESSRPTKPLAAARPPLSPLLPLSPLSPLSPFNITVRLLMFWSPRSSGEVAHAKRDRPCCDRMRCGN